MEQPAIQWNVTADLQKGLVKAPRLAGQQSAQLLDSWKAIAAYLNKDVRTVQRWEKSLGLPVRRLQDSGSGSVFAYCSEVDAWRDRRALRIAQDRLPLSPPAGTESPVSQITVPSLQDLLPGKPTLWLAALMGVLVGAAATTVFFLFIQSVRHHQF